MSVVHSRRLPHAEDPKYSRRGLVPAEPARSRDHRASSRARLEEAKATLQSLRNVGIKVALDDFGTGYAGLFHVRELQFDTIKIDRSFVTDMVEKPEEGKIVEAIVGLGCVLGLQTTAEGIESQDVLDQLRKLGCETGQGFLFGRPEPFTGTTPATSAQP